MDPDFEKAQNRICFKLTGRIRICFMWQVGSGSNLSLKAQIFIKKKITRISIESDQESVFVVVKGSNPDQVFLLVGSESDLFSSVGSAWYRIIWIFKIEYFNLTLRYTINIIKHTQYCSKDWNIICTTYIIKFIYVVIETKGIV